MDRKFLSLATLDQNTATFRTTPEYSTAVSIILPRSQWSEMGTPLEITADIQPYLPEEESTRD